MAYSDLLRFGRVSDLPEILRLERSPAALPFVGQWSEERHRDTLGSADARYFVADDDSGGLAAYVILRGFAESSGSIELKRIVVGLPGNGLGRRLLNELIRIVFDEQRAHRFFLDVFEDNQRARRLYESVGFRYEGTMREAASRDGAWFSLMLMSMLVHEYAETRD